MMAILLAMISAAVIMAAGMIAVLEVIWPALIIVGVIGLAIYLLDRFGVLPDRRKRPNKNKRYRRKR